MTNEFYYEIDSIIKTNKLHRFNAELVDLTLHATDTKNKKEKERKETLQKLIDDTNAHKNKNQIKKDIMKNHIEVLKSSQYQKKWQFLNETQKENRIDELAQRLILNPEIVTRLKKYITTGTIKTKNIEYDVPKGIITAIKSLSIDENNNYQLEYLMNDDPAQQKDDEVPEDSDLELCSRNVTSKKPDKKKSKKVVKKDDKNDDKKDNKKVVKKVAKKSPKKSPKPPAKKVRTKK